MKRRDVLAGIGGLALSGVITPSNATGVPSTSGQKRTLLRIDSSSRVQGSYSRQLADVIEATWKQRYPGGDVMLRDLVRQPVTHVQNDAIEGFYTLPDQFNPTTKKAMSSSDTLAKELQGAQDLLFSIPMYNFSVPSAFKAWIDQVVRPGYAFEYTADGQIRGLLNDKRAYVALAYGFEYARTALAAHDFLKPYLQATFGYIGLTNVKFVEVEGTALGDAAKLERNMSAAVQAASRLVT